jgi:predicted ester cyclase
MSRDDNIAALSVILPIAQRRDWDRLDEAFAPDVVDHDAVEGQPPGLEGLKWYWRNFTAAFPDFRTAPVVLSADEDYVTLVARFSGTHTGEYRGHAPTGRTFSVHMIQVVRFAGGHIVERWGGLDALGLLQQLGLG